MIDDSETVEATVRSVLRDVLGIDQGRSDAFEAGSELFGALPEFDSMAVATVLTELEDRLGIVIDDDEVEAKIFDTFGALVGFARGKALG